MEIYVAWKRGCNCRAFGENSEKYRKVLNGCGYCNPVWPASERYSLGWYSGYNEGMYLGSVLLWLFTILILWVDYSELSGSNGRVWGSHCDPSRKDVHLRILLRSIQRSLLAFAVNNQQFTASEHAGLCSAWALCVCYCIFGQGPYLFWGQRYVLVVNPDPSCIFICRVYLRCHYIYNQNQVWKKWSMH